MDIPAPSGCLRAPTGTPFTLLLIERKPLGTDYLSLLFGQFNPSPVNWVHTVTCDDGLARLSEAGIHGVQGVLLDAEIPDGPIQHIIPQLAAAAPQTPIVVVADQWDYSLVRQALQAGAQDYLLKEPTDALLLLRALYMAVERQQSKWPAKAYTPCPPRNDVYSAANSTQEWHFSDLGITSPNVITRNIQRTRRWASS